MPPTNASPFKPICLTMAANAGKPLDYDNHALELQTLLKRGDRCIERYYMFTRGNSFI